jgi:DNA-binding MarR family transcriptional regulator
MHVIGGKQRAARALARGTGRAAYTVNRWADEKTCENSLVTPFTAPQGRYLAYIYIYTPIHGRPPAESDLQQYFRVTPPAVHQMVVTLDRNGLVARTRGTPRSMRVLVPPNDLPLLEFLLPTSDQDA